MAEVFSTRAVGRVGARFVSSRNSAVSNHGVFVDSVEAGIALRHHSGWFTDVLTRSRPYFEKISGKLLSISLSAWSSATSSNMVATSVFG